MTTAEFIRLVGGYWGNYTDVQKAIVTRYLDGQEPEYKALLLDTMVSTFSTRWGKPPAVYEFAEARETVQNVLALRREEEIKRTKMILAGESPPQELLTRTLWAEIVIGPGSNETLSIGDADEHHRRQDSTKDGAGERGSLER